MSIESNMIRMEFKGNAEVNAAPKEIFEILTIPDKLVKFIPGVKKYSYDENGITMDVPVGFSFIRGTFKVKLKTLSSKAPSYVELKGSGSGSGSSVDFLTKFSIDPSSKGSKVSWDAAVNVGGIAATFGGPMIKRAADKFISQIIEDLKKKLQ